MRASVGRRVECLFCETNARTRVRRRWGRRVRLVINFDNGKISLRRRERRDGVFFLSPSLPLFLSARGHVSENGGREDREQSSLPERIRDSDERENVRARDTLTTTFCPWEISMITNHRSVMTGKYRIKIAASHRLLAGNGFARGYGFAPPYRHADMDLLSTMCRRSHRPLIRHFEV